MEYLLAMLINLLVQAIALPIAKSLVKVWTWLYTWPAPRDERQSRRAEVVSDLHEQILDARIGSTETTVAFRILFRMLWGLKDDVVWFTPYLPALIAQKIESGGAILSRIRIPDLMVPSLAFLIVSNALLLVPSDSQAERDWISTNVSTLRVIGIIWIVYISPLGRLVESIMKIKTLLVTTVVVVILTSLDLHNSPGFYRILIAVSPLILAIVIDEEAFRLFAFKGQRKLVVLSWGVILTVSLSVAWLTGYVLALLAVWGVIGLMTLIVAIVYLLAVGLAAGILYGSKSVTANGMRLAATGIRRLL